jgi:indolepyruvate ferredoxin oxidoreductase
MPRTPSRPGSDSSAKPPAKPPHPGLPDDYQLSDRYTRDQGPVFMTGIQALARLPLEQLRADRAAGLRTAAFLSGYPGSPLGGYDKAIASAARQASDLPINCRPALNEEYAATAVMGSQLAAAQPDCRYDGVVGIWYGKAPGVDRASDALRHAVYAGSSHHGGAIALVGDDPGAKSSTLPSSSAGTLFDMHIPMLYPGDPGEALDLGRHAIALARCTGLWAGLKIVADVADGSATVWLDADRIQPQIPLHNGAPYVCIPDGRLLTPHTIDLEREIYEVRYALAVEYASANQLNYTTVDSPNAWFGIVSSGITYREVREALRRLGLASESQIADAGIRLLKMQMPLPFNPETIQHFSRGLGELLVIEEKQPNIESLVKDALYNLTEHPLVTGKFDELGGSLLPGHGSLSADDILPALRRRLAGTLGDRLAPEPPAPDIDLTPISVQRSPFYCSGCPHNRSTQVAKGALVGAGIGCHTMTMLMDPHRVGDIAGLTCMGNEGVQWIGMSEFVERNHMIQNLGDGTFFHSGQLAIQAAVAAGVSITYKLLWNGAVAMTGGQDAPGRTSIASVAQILLTQGVARVLVTSDDVARTSHEPLPEGVEVWERSRLIEAQQLLARIDGVTVLIHDQACAAESRRARKRNLAPTPNRRVTINARVCEGCGDCGRISNCLSVQPIETPFGRKTAIDTGSCNLDFSCLEGDCPSFMTVSQPPEWQLSLRRWWRGSRSDPQSTDPSMLPAAVVFPDADIPDPVIAVNDPDDFATRMTGVGGTGVVTVSQVLGTAAAFDGFEVRGLDQIGLSQKAGPVVGDLRLRRGRAAETNRIGAGCADLLLAFDSLAASSPAGLLVAAPDRTAAVGSTTETPTGAMITQTALELPGSDQLTARIGRVTRPDQQHWADASAITKALLGDSVTANLFVVGMAIQAGCLPIRPESIERALALNGVAVDSNCAAFRWGRIQIADPRFVSRAMEPLTSTTTQTDKQPALPDSVNSQIDAICQTCQADAELATSLQMFSRDLIDHQDLASAGRFLSTLGRVARSEAQTAPGSHRLTGAVAKGLHKLMAYKDEYEVARLLVCEEGLASATQIAGETGKISWLLHPPLLRALGLKRKIRVGIWARPAMALLAAGKRMRGTPLDPFGWTRLRRIERDLPSEYCVAIERVLSRLKPGRIDEAIAIARLPSDVRGYEDIKLANIKRYQQHLNELLDRFELEACE